MDTFTHLALAFLGGIGMRLEGGRGFRYVSLLSMLSVLVDLDHLLVPLGLTGEFRTLHNVYVMLLLPLAFLLFSIRLERGSGSDRWQTFFLVLLVMLSGHLLFDMVETYVLIFYPFSAQYYGVPRIDLQLTGEFASGVVQTIGLALVIYAFIVAVGALAYRTMRYANEGGLSVYGSFRKAVSDLF